MYGTTILFKPRALESQLSGRCVAATCTIFTIFTYRAAFPTDYLLSKPVTTLLMTFLDTVFKVGEKLSLQPSSPNFNI